ncbi:MAG TPA: acyl-CoA dehydrogenase family protein [Acidimicrobiales bacterium]|nr:acyl-CoA dehydrogenase family protein [Acidimicrobiales bacterium]
MAMAAVRDPVPAPGSWCGRGTPRSLTVSSQDRGGAVSQQVTEAEFTEQAQRFLEANCRLREAEKTGWGQGTDSVSIFAEKTRDQELAEVEEAKEWRRKVFDAGFGWITGPAAYGGRELPSSYERLWQSLESAYDTPGDGPFGIGLGMIAPTILAHATDKVKDAYLRSLHRGDIIACQLFSEPSNGSDLAGIQTRAIRDGEEWVVTGQKVWTSGAQYSDIGEIICRTDPDAPKHKGLTMFVVDMHAPGVEVRPLRQMTGGASFNEVFFTEVRIPDDHRLGDVNNGWTVALTTLMNERASIGSGGAGTGGAMSTTRLIELLRHMGRDKDPVLRQQLADIYVNTQVAAYNNQRAMAKIKAGQLPGPEMSVAKLSLTNNMRRVAEFVGSALGPRLTADDGQWGTFAWSEYVLGVPGMRVAGGTDEIMKNIVGERVLGLPKEPSGDR